MCNHTKNMDKSTEKAKLVVAYHGTPHGGFDKFSITKRGTGADTNSVGDYGKGFYFSPDKKYASTFATEIIKKRSDIKAYTPAIYTVNLVMEKPFDLGLLNKFQNAHTVLAKKYGIFKIPESEYDRVLNELGLNQIDLDFYYEVSDLIGDNWADFNIKKKIAEKGFDSLISTDGNEFIVYAPRQIKITKIEYL